MTIQSVVDREGRVACIGVLLTDQKGSQHLRADAAREQEDGLGGRYSIGVGRLRQLPVLTHTTQSYPSSGGLEQKAADLAVQAGSRLYTDSASSYRALKGYGHEFVNHTKKEYASGEAWATRALAVERAGTLAVSMVSGS